jgi:hypothetical protein
MISALLPPEKPCGAMAPLAAAGVFQSFPKRKQGHLEK